MKSFTEFIKINLKEDSKSEIEQHLANKDINSFVNGNEVKVHDSDVDAAKKHLEKAGYKHQVSGGLNEGMDEAVDKPEDWEVKWTDHNNKEQRMVHRQDPSKPKGHAEDKARAHAKDLIKNKAAKGQMYVRSIKEGLDEATNAGCVKGDKVTIKSGLYGSGKKYGGKSGVITSTSSDGYCMVKLHGREVEFRQNELTKSVNEAKDQTPPDSLAISVNSPEYKKWLEKRKNKKLQKPKTVEKDGKVIYEDSYEDDLDEAVEISHDRYMRSHGKKAREATGGWMFTHKSSGSVNHDDDTEVHHHNGSLSDAKKSAKAWAKKHGHSTAYIMEDTIDEAKVFKLVEGMDMNESYRLPNDSEINKVKSHTKTNHPDKSLVNVAVHRKTKSIEYVVKDKDGKMSNHTLDEAKSTVVKDKDGKVVSWSQETDWEKSDKKKVDTQYGRSKAANLVGKALKKDKELHVGEEFDLGDYSLDELQDFALSEEFEELNELDKKTLSNYIKKSTDGKLTKEERQSPVLTYKEFMESISEGKIDDLKDKQLLKKAYTDSYDDDYKDDGKSKSNVTKVKGRSYGSGKETDDDENEPEDKVKRGRGRPHGSKSGARI